MAEVYETVEGPMGVAVKLGLGNPLSRGLVGGGCASALCYGMKFPRASFRKDGTMKPCALISVDPEATAQHFLLVPVLAGAFFYLFT